MIKEEDRLATTIESIDYDVRIVPRGAYSRTALGTVVVNRCFEGGVIDFCFLLLLI